MSQNISDLLRAFLDNSDRLCAARLARVSEEEESDLLSESEAIERKLSSADSLLAEQLWWRAWPEEVATRLAKKTRACVVSIGDASPPRMTSPVP